MVRPKGFGFNHQTATSNSFQKKIEGNDVLKKAQSEFDQMVEKLQSKNVSVKVFEDLRGDLPDSIFPNNWISHTANQLVIYPMLTENRRAEVRSDVIDFFSNELNVEAVLDYSQRVTEELFLEGTGSIIFDHSNKLAYACISPRTDVKLLNQLCAELGYRSITFESVDLKGGQIYHTNVMLSVAEHFAVVCLESIPDLLERSLLKKSLENSGKEVIDISYRQMNQFAANALEVAAKDGQFYYCLSKTSLDSLTPNQAERIEIYSKLLDFEIPTIENVGGGSVRCMMAGFFNYPK
ncbi:MAG: arginine deiminase-related protein [Crocinitomicaceae bacterium]